MLLLLFSSSFFYFRFYERFRSAKQCMRCVCTCVIFVLFLVYSSFNNNHFLCNLCEAFIHFWIFREPNIERIVKCNKRNCMFFFCFFNLCVWYLCLWWLRMGCVLVVCLLLSEYFFYRQAKMNKRRSENDNKNNVETNEKLYWCVFVWPAGRWFKSILIGLLYDVYVNKLDITVHISVCCACEIFVVFFFFLLLLQSILCKQIKWTH